MGAGLGVYDLSGLAGCPDRAQRPARRHIRFHQQHTILFIQGRTEPSDFACKSICAAFDEQPDRLSLANGGAVALANLQPQAERVYFHQLEYGSSSSQVLANTSHTRLDRTVAIKVLRASETSRVEATARFLREGKAGFGEQFRHIQARYGEMP